MTPVPVEGPATESIPLQPISRDVHLDVVEPRELPTPPRTERSCWGRVFHDWSQVVLLASGVIGPGAVLVGFVIKSMILAGVGGLIFLVGGTVVFIRIGCLKPQRDLENDLEFYRQELEKSMQLQDKLKVDINRITAIKEALESDVVKANASVEELRSLLTQDTADFNKIAIQIGAFQSQANGLVELYKKFGDMIVEFKKQRDQTQRINVLFQEKIRDLGGTIQTFEGNEGEFLQGVEKHVTNIQNILKANEDMKEEIQDLQESKKDLEQQVVSLVQHVGELVQQVRAIDPKIDTKGLSDLKAILTQLEQVTQKIEDDK